MGKRLFIVSNRLPVTFDEENGIQQASGGLITAINSYLERENTSAYKEVLWSGVPGCNMVTWRTSIEKLEHASFNYLPVFVNASEYDH
jgi:trehalose 6-phosphate synthase/phosphatase